jgi:hypothetical protein
VTEELAEVGETKVPPPENTVQFPVPGAGEFPLKVKLVEVIDLSGPALAIIIGETVTFVVPAAVQPPAEVTVTLYVPAAAADAAKGVGFWIFDVNALGPVQL